MNSTPSPKPTDPPDVDDMAARLEEANARAYEQFKQELARVNKQLANAAHDAAHHPSDDPQTGMTTLRPAARPAAVNNVQVPDDRPSLGWRAVRGFTGFLLAAAGIVVAAIAWQSFYGDKAKQPQLALTTSMENPELLAQPSPSSVQADEAKGAPPQSAPLAQTVPEDVTPTTVAPTTAALPPELAQLLQTLARDLATVGQGIEQLKASQEQLTRDNARIAEQVKATQEQIATVIANASEQNLRRKRSAPRPPPIATPTR